jgi:pyrroloquinoline quinone biosynthesis protein E
VTEVGGPGPLSPSPLSGVVDPRPYTLVAELTYQCPLRCVYCSNPVELARHAASLGTEDWLRVLREAESLGVVQLNLTGGEPLVRRDLEDIVREARRLDLYTNLITSGVSLTRERLHALRGAGLDALQLSIQALDAGRSRRIAGLDALEQKLLVAEWVRELGMPLTLNFVLHRENLGEVREMIALAERLGASRVELANTQYLGWALLNREALLPSREALREARDIARAEKERLKGKLELLFVLPDYYAQFPKPCMDGWAQRYIVVTPDGLVLPCQAAHTITDLTFERVTERSLNDIWQSSPALLRFRGESWMREPCASCERREQDFGGCRCQAFHLTGDASATDPVCSLSPDHGIIERAREQTTRVELQYRSLKRLPVV